MKQLKQVCQQHKSAVICFADGQPICSFCESSEFWVLESCQSLVEEQYDKGQLKKKKFRILLISLQQEFKQLIRQFEIFEQEILTRINIFIDMYLCQDYKFDEIHQLNEKIHQIIKSFIVLPKFYKNGYQPDKIFGINIPKKYKITTLNAFEQQKVQTATLKEKLNGNQQRVEQHNQQQKVKDQQNEIVNEQAIQERDNQNDIDNLKHITLYDLNFSEQQFYNRVKNDLIGLKIFQEFYLNKLSTDIAPQYLLNLNRQQNFFLVYTSDNMCILGYSKNYKLKGRGKKIYIQGIAFNTKYIENGYYIDGLLVWGQIFYANTQDLIMYEEIDNSDDLETIMQYGNDSSNQKLKLFQQYGIGRTLQEQWDK